MPRAASSVKPKHYNAWEQRCLWNLQQLSESVQSMLESTDESKQKQIKHIGFHINCNIYSNKLNIHHFFHKSCGQTEECLNLESF